MWAKRGARESHVMLPGVQESVREQTFTLPNELPFWELESRWNPKSLKSNCKGQNPLDRGAPYIIEKLLELNCIVMTFLVRECYGSPKKQEF